MITPMTSLAMYIAQQINANPTAFQVVAYYKYISTPLIHIHSQIRIWKTLFIWQCTALHITEHSNVAKGR